MFDLRNFQQNNMEIHCQSEKPSFIRNSMLILPDINQSSVEIPRKFKGSLHYVSIRRHSQSHRSLHFVMELKQITTYLLNPIIWNGIQAIVQINLRQTYLVRNGSMLQLCSRKKLTCERYIHFCAAIVSSGTSSPKAVAR